MKIHMVKKGETLYELSKKYGVSLEELIEANPQLSNPNELSVGDKVKIPSQATPVPAPEQIIHKHAVKQGDSLWKLSKAWGISLKEMIDANPQLKNPNALLLGEIVNIPKSGMTEQPQNNNQMPDKTIPGSKTHTGPKENMTAPMENVTAPKENVIAPKPTQPVIPQLPQLPEMPLPQPEKVSTQPLPNPNPPIPVPLPVVPVPVYEKPVEPVQPMPIPEVEHIELEQHLYIQFPVPTEEVVYKKPVEANPMPYGEMNSPGFENTSYYPGLADNSSFTQPTQYNCPPYYEQPNIWAHAQVEQLCCPEVYPMSYAIPDCYTPYNMPTYIPQSVGGENSQYLNCAPTPMPVAPVAVNFAPYYSCTSPYEWTFPQTEVQGAYQTLPNAPFGGYESGHLMSENNAPKDCGCRQPDELLQGGASESDIAEEVIAKSDELLVSREEVKSKETVDDNKATIKSVKKNNAAPRKKQVKSKSSRHRRYNPWING
ncbi:LysM peptidoglycan-binding domain-containing protein [Paenibacillus sp. IHBB 10380]|uniref:LysM peptidoglycan-binding domain-containing protein n=1 Tax=Paenibacillus sp. IHBB 10380 TaxID=1566358 RepID=UPI0006991D05|nr:LysM peptidoglycan-binding domain-containing protein [Paenibacillus sp. IHBB 10380]